MEQWRSVVLQVRHIRSCKDFSQCVSLCHPAEAPPLINPQGPALSMEHKRSFRPETISFLRIACSVLARDALAE